MGGDAEAQARHVEVRHADEAEDGVHQLCPFGSLSQDVQPITYLRARQLAEVAVDVLHQVGEVAAGQVGDRVRYSVLVELRIPLVRVTVGVPVDELSEVLVQLRLLDELPDLLLDERQLARVELFHLVVLVHQPGQLLDLPISLRRRHRRRQVVHHYSVRAPLRLRALARVVDDERVNERQIPQEEVGVALGGDSDALARQPFKRAVLAEVYNRVCAPATLLRRLRNPAVQSVVRVRRRQVGHVVDRCRVHTVAPGRLDGYKGVPELDPRERESAAVIHVVPTRRRSPLGLHLRAVLRG